MYSSHYTSPSRRHHTPTKSSSSPYISPGRYLNVTPPKSSSVIAAFRELQDKARRIESERAHAIRVREEVRDLIAATHRARALWHQQSEILSTEALLNSKSESERLRTSFEELRLKTDSLEETYRLLQRGLLTEKSKHGNLDVEVSQLHDKIRELERRNQMLTRDAEFVNCRCDELLEGATSSPMVHRSQASKTRASLIELERQIEKVRQSSHSAQIKSEGLQSYINLLIGINEDLVTTITAKELTKDKILEFAKKYAPPRYTWPKNLHYDDIVELITNAAISAAKDGAIARAAAATLQAVRYSPLRSSVPSTSTTIRPRSAPPRTRPQGSISNSLLEAFNRATLYDDFNIKPSSRRSSVGRRSSKDDSVGYSSAAVANSLARAAAKAAEATVSTHAPTIQEIASYQLALGNAAVLSHSHPSSASKSKRKSSPLRNSGGNTNFLNLNSPVNFSESNPVSPYREYRGEGGIHLDSTGGVGGAFIPAGSSSSGAKEFNELANKSIATRAGKNISSAMISKVRSFHGESFADC